MRPPLKPYHWGWVTFWFIVFWPIGICLAYSNHKKFKTTLTIMAGMALERQ